VRFNNIVVKLTTEALAANLHNQQIKMIESWRGGSGGGAAGGNVFCKVLRRSSRCAKAVFSLLAAECIHCDFLLI
jgi:hypothetical protein